MNPIATFDINAEEAVRQRHMAAHNGGLSLTSTAQALRDQARHAAEVVSDRTAAAKARTTRYVAEEPAKSLLVAAAAGALIAGLAMLLSSNRGR